MKAVKERERERVHLLDKKYFETIIEYEISHVNYIIAHVCSNLVITAILYSVIDSSVRNAVLY